MRFLLFLSIFVACILAISLCPKGFFYEKELAICLKYEKHASQWDAALETCTNLGGDLLSIHNVFSNGIIASAVYNETGNDSPFWLGAHRKNENKTWKWSDGSKFNYDRFDPNKPDNVAGCVYLDPVDRFWRVMNCNVSLAFVCITPILTTTTVAPTTSPLLKCLPVSEQPVYNCLKGWQRSSQTGYQYLVIYNQTFTQGETYCKREGAHLASVHSKKENDFITNLCCQSSENSWANGQWPGIYMLGGQRDDNYQFSWTDGSPFDYESKVCYDYGTATYVTLMNYEASQQGDCARGQWGYYPSDEIYESPPYLVCKKK